MKAAPSFAGGDAVSAPSNHTGLPDQLKTGIEHRRLQICGAGDVRIGFGRDVQPVCARAFDQRQQRGRRGEPHTRDMDDVQRRLIEARDDAVLLESTMLADDSFDDQEKR